MTRKITKTAFGCLLSCAICAALSSCTDKLDEQPDSRWININDTKKVQQLLTSGYPKAVPAVVCELMGDNLVDNNVVVPATHNDPFSLFHEEAYKWEDIKSYSTSDDDTPYEIWDRYYFGIATANHAIEAMKQMGDSTYVRTDPNISASWGEAHLMRAYFHWVLVNVFAEAYKDEQQSSQDWGVPYVTTVEDVVNIDYSDTLYAKRVSEVYRLIEKDLLEGIDLIDDSKYTVPAYHFNRNAAYAFAARFYLFKRDYRKCVKYADLALGGNPATSLRDWAGMNTNTIYTMLNAYNDEAAPCNYLLQTTYSLQDRMLSACRYAINVGAKFKVGTEGIDSVVPNVPNTSAILYEGGGPNWSGRIPAFDGKIFRWTDGSEYGSWLFRVYEYFEYTNKIAGIGYVHIIYQPFTAEETLLCRAEAELYLGQIDKAVSDLGYWTASKTIDEPLTLQRITGWRNYQGTPATSDWVDDLHPQDMSPEFPVLTGDALLVLRCILHFRRIETMFEGLRWFDIKRYGITVHHAYRGPLDYNVTHDYLRWDDPRRVLKVPYNVADAGYDPEKGSNRTLQGSGGDGNLKYFPYTTK